MHDLACSMNTGVSSACSEALHRPMRIKLCNGILQHGLNAATVALTLPSTKRRALVLKTERNPLKGR
tara:strand:+ start:387 stop:587 length:201 start_codon:yes stop_codon:yes gene_type:complete